VFNLLAGEPEYLDTLKDEPRKVVGHRLSWREINYARASPVPRGLPEALE
jgi:hypothetical protein